MEFYVFLLVLCMKVLPIPATHDYEIVRPEMLDHQHNRMRRSIYTKLPDEDKHVDKLTLKIPTQQKDFVLDLKKKRTFSDGGITVRTFDENGKSQHKTTVPEDCHYVGVVKDHPNSHAHISTCHGVTGTIQDGEETYDILPHDNEKGDHKFIKAADIIKKASHQVNKDHEIFHPEDQRFDTEEPTTSEKHPDKIITTHKVTKDNTVHLANTENVYMPYLKSNVTKFVEIFVSIDRQIFEYYGRDEKLVIEKALHTVSQLDMSYQAINIRLVLVAIEIQKEGPHFTRSLWAHEELGAFSKYYKDVIMKDLSFLSIDNAVFLSHRSWHNGVIGLAFVGATCSSLATSIVGWSFYDISGPVFVLGHEIGHTLNFPHDGDTCRCLSERGCFMKGSKSSKPGFSDCSLKYFAKKDYACLSNYPKSTVVAVCGNGIIEGNEECDCGTPEMCSKIDPCCQPHHCRLKAHAQCSYQNSPTCCSQKCLFKKQGELCRSSESNCDLPEFCTGDSAKCPKDEVMRDGSSCGDSKKLIAGTEERYKGHLSQLSPRVYGRYFKFIPKYWGKKDYPCMAIEMFGCGKDDDQFVTPTPITTKALYYHSPMCIKLKAIDTCQQHVADGTPLIYKTTEHHDCNHEHMLFVHGVDGTLTHHCSQKRVCPNDKGQLVVSSQCELEVSKFTRTKKKSLKHIQSNKCALSEDHWPHSNDIMALRGICDEVETKRTELIFLNTDCVLPMNFTNGKLPDTAFTSKTHMGIHSAHEARYSRRTWCGESKNDETWLQVDLGKEVKVSSIIVKGCYFGFVMSYYLMFSNDGVHWDAYKESHATSWKDMNSYCYRGNCIKTYDHQCQQLWSAASKKAKEPCWKEMNVKNETFGTCDPFKHTYCKERDMYCGQIQCESKYQVPYYVNYGSSYTTQMINSSKCSAASIMKSEQSGFGMVSDGTKCGQGKMCMNQKCLTSEEHGIKHCPFINGTECNGKGICRSDGKCFCHGGYDPSTGCKTPLIPVNGGWSAWSSWGLCNKACGSGQHIRHRYCNQPIAKHGGKQCEGDWKEYEGCNKEPCPAARSCKQMKSQLESKGKHAFDGIYLIQPSDGIKIKAYCDMTRHGGGWTLLITSLNNRWTPENVLERNIEEPSLSKDYSILKYGDAIKRASYMMKPHFEYMLEAHNPDEWGGIWRADGDYSLKSTDRYQSNVRLLKKFSDWSYSNKGIVQRVPYLYHQRLTMSEKPDKVFWGTITDNRTDVVPASWIQGKQKMEAPNKIWYWVRESDVDIPGSCLEIMLRGMNFNTPYKSGVYNIQPKRDQIVKTYCDFERHGGGWALLAVSKRGSRWTKDESLANGTDPSGDKFSLFGLVDHLKQRDPAEIEFEYIIEAEDSKGNKHGGIFTSSTKYSLLTCPPHGSTPKLIQKIGVWNETEENIAKYPVYFANKDNKIFITASSDKPSDTLGTIISDNNNGVFMKSLPSAEVVKVWIREGGSRKSCNDIKVHGYHKGKLDYEDGYYRIENSQIVYCDMTTTPNEGWTLMLTSKTPGWNMDQVKSRNANRPSLHDDYSILNQAEKIKKLSQSDFFKYMLDATARADWGGIWRAPINYPLASTSSARYEVTMVEQFGQWDYEKRWYQNPRQRMPYMASGNREKALLTTATYTYYTEWGSIVANDSQGYVPAKWITPQKESPGVIWYWINENDCEDDYKPVHGGFEPWSEWSQCSVFCGVGKQVRRRLCNTPLPKCGGDPCDPKEKRLQERECQGECSTSIIRTKSDEYCVVPKTNGCDEITTKTDLILSSSRCDQPEAKFIYNPSNGELRHQCSQQLVCEKDWTVGIDVNCQHGSSGAQFSRMFDFLRASNKRCIGLSNGETEDSKIKVHSSCKDILRFPEIANGPVNSDFFLNMPTNIKNIAQIKALPKYPAFPSFSTHLDNFDAPHDIGSYYALKTWTYFKAPETGEYRFSVSCDDFCSLFLGENQESTEEIVTFTSWVPLYVWNRHPSQTSHPINLIAGQKYYMEMIAGEIKGADHFTVAVKFPDGKFVGPITTNYLHSNSE